ncbi:MAG: biotin/lipoyl-binding protein, partial [Planctomycetia bacterium]|nr:biotin/lipoyl-binding protein [Planctomycetia bacterium]
MAHKSFYFILSAVLISQCVLLTACKKTEKQAEAPPAGAAVPAALVTAEKVEARIPETVKKYVGTFEAIESVDVVARVAGKIMEMNVEEGKNVQAGEQLFKIEDTVYKANLASAVASVATSEANIKTSEANLKSATAAVEDLEAKLRYALNNYVRNTRLYCGDCETFREPFVSLLKAELNSESILAGLKNINEMVTKIESPAAAVSKDSYENAETTVKSAVAALESARAALQAAEGTLGSARASLDVA